MSQAYPSPILIVPGAGTPSDVDKIVKAIQDRGESMRGLSKRELFAAMAMQGLLANSHNSVLNECATYDDAADLAVLHADALLKRLAAEPVDPNP